MADVEAGVSGNLTVSSESKSSDKKSLEAAMAFPVKLNLSAPAAQEWVSTRRKNLKPWLVFVQTSKFQAPPTVAALGGRIVKNVDHFQSNYFCVFILLILYCLLTSPLLLFAVGASLGACHVLSKRSEDKNITVLGHELTLAQQYGLVAMVSLPVFFLAGAGSVVFWVLGASLFFIVLHASFYNTELPEESFDFPVQPVQQV